MKKTYLAFDLGAESGRAILGCLDAGRLEMTELHRFANRPLGLPDGLHWNLLNLWGNLLDGLSKAVRHCGDNGMTLASVGADTWGVDFGLLGRSGQLLGLPFAYRDTRNPAAMAKALAAIPREELFDITGSHFHAFNTLFQLVAWRDAEPQVLAQADKLLFMPDLLHYFLCGHARVESTSASTSQMVDPRVGSTGRWAADILRRLDLPTQMLGAIGEPASVLGRLLPHVREHTGAGDIRVITPAGHDTASAVAAVPASGADGWAFLSSGTWSLMGVELPHPVISARALAGNFTNERCLDGRIRLLRNIPGLWLVQQVRADLPSSDNPRDYAHLAEHAGLAVPFRTLVDPWHEPFGVAGGMLAKMQRFATRTGQRVPQMLGEFVRCCLESLAMEYRRTLEMIEELAGRRVEVIHVVGGGGRNALLNRMLCDATNRPVIVGPFEATAAGNILAQAMGDGELATPADVRQVIRASGDLTMLQPSAPQAWDDQYARYLRVIGARS